MIAFFQLFFMFVVAIVTCVAWFAFISTLATWMWEDKPVGEDVAKWAAIAALASTMLITLIKA